MSQDGNHEYVTSGVLSQTNFQADSGDQKSNPHFRTRDDTICDPQSFNMAQSSHNNQIREDDVSSSFLLDSHRHQGPPERWNIEARRTSRIAVSPQNHDEGCPTLKPNGPPRMPRPTRQDRVGPNDLGPEKSIQALEVNLSHVDQSKKPDRGFLGDDISKDSLAASTKPSFSVSSARKVDHKQTSSSTASEHMTFTRDENVRYVSFGY